MGVTNTKKIQVSVGSTRHAAIDMRSMLDSGELLTGTPAIVEVTTSDLSITNKAVNTSEIQVNGKAVEIGGAVQFTVSGHVSDGGEDGEGTYRIRVTVSTDASQTLSEDFLIEAR